MVKSAFFFGLLIATSVAFFALLLPFFEPILWAVTLAVLFRPIQSYFLSLLNQRENWASLITLVLIIILVIVPAFFLLSTFAKEGFKLYQAIIEGDIDLSRPIGWVQSSWPSLLEQLKDFGLNIDELKSRFSASALKSSQWIAAHIFAFGQNTLRFTIMFFLMLYLLFFFLRDGKKLVDLIVKTFPLDDAQERLLLTKFAEVSRATIKGTLVVGMVQGMIGGVTFALLGIESAIFWGVVMTLLSILPAIGSALVWLPTAIYLIANGMVTEGVILLVVGGLVISMVDNILRPILVGRDTKMPDYLILLSTLGGLAMIGISGFVLGPLIAAFFLAIWSMFAREYNSSQ